MNDRLATCDSVLPEGDVPAMIHLFPRGHFKARDGRAFTLDQPQGVIEAFREGGIDLPVDFEHQNDNPVALASGPVRAAGWITGLQYFDAGDKEGLWGTVKWTTTAAAMIRRREYRFISPTFLHDGDGNVRQLKGAALVHNPALRLTALAREEARMSADAEKPAGGTLLAKMVQLFDLPETASESDVILKVAQLMIAPGARVPDAEPDPAKYVPAQAVETIVAQRNRELATARENRIAQKVTEALKAGAFLPPLKDWALALGRADEAALDTFIARCGLPFAHLKTELAHMNRPPPGSGELFASEAEATVCRQLGLKPGALKD